MVTTHLFGQTAPPQDFGDAPAPYPTTLRDNGARHGILQGLHLGLRIDAELDGQPDPNALGDDAPTAAGPGDEDGVTFVTPQVPGEKAVVDVVASETGRLEAWIDFDANGSWKEPADQIFANLPLNAGTNRLTFLVPASAHPGFTFARFRLSKKGGLSFAGPAPDGEVEDYRVQIGQGETFADVSLVKRATPNPAAVGSKLTYTLLVQNSGPAMANNVTVTDILRPNVSYLSATSSQGTCNQAAGTVTCALGSLGASATANITIIVIPTSAVLLTNRACVSATNPDAKPDNNCAQTLTEVTGGPVTPPCDFTNKGTDFWLAFPANYAPDPTNRPQLSLQSVGPEKVSGQVTIPGLGFATNWSIPAGMIATVNLPWQADLGGLNDATTNKGVHITATGETAVYALNHAPFTSDAYLGLPSAVLGADYIILGYPNVHTDVPELSGTQFALVATEDNTAVTITPRVSTNSFSPIPSIGPASGFSGAQLSVAPGKHTLTQASTTSQPFGVTVYGFAPYDSYGYPGGLRLADFQPPVITCPNSLIVLTLRATNSVASVPSVQATVHDNCTPDTALQITQRPAAGTLLLPGTYDLVFSSTDLAGNRAECAIPLQIRVVPPRIDVARDQDAIVIRWSENAILESAVSVTGPWNEVPKAQSPYTVPLRQPNIASRAFFRTRCPDCR